VPIVSLVLFCIGSILSLQMAPILDSYGVIEQVADIISIAIFRELGPLVAASCDRLAGAHRSRRRSGSMVVS
jgi:ABC-type transporter Mla maintaining outer membrane lipid asymmetry permease subunit MlaE